MIRRLLWLALLQTVFSLSIRAQATMGYYRYPALHGDWVVFTAEGDLWRMQRSTGWTQRLTAHPGQELYAHISPDGRWIAYTGEYEGPQEVYLMPLEGGLPRRITYDGEQAIVVGWTPDGHILYSTRHYSTLPNAQLVRVDPDNPEPEVLPLAQASDGCIDATDGTLYFTRMPFQGSHTRRYKGGTAQNIWKYHPGDAEATPLTADYAGTSKAPMLYNGRLYFASDRDGVMNLWSMNTRGKDLRQHTFSAFWDIKSPNGYKGQIVYQKSADIWLFDAAANREQKLEIRLVSDFNQRQKRWIKNATDQLSSVHLSADGEQVALTSRGRVFVAPAKQGRLVEVTRQYGIRYSDARFLPGTANLFMFSDASGEMEVWKAPANGIGAPEQLTRDNNIVLWEAYAAPDGRHIAYHDKNARLWLYDVETKTQTPIDSSGNGDFSDISWSPGSQWLAYVRPAANNNSQVVLYSLQGKTRQTVTTDRLDNFQPAWSPDGHWLYFLSDRDFRTIVRSPWGSRQPEPFYDKTTQIYLLALQPGLRSPFMAPDELTAKPEKEKKDETKKDEKPAGDSVVTEGLERRLFELPLPGRAIRDIALTDKYVYWLERPQVDEGKQNLMALKIGNEGKPDPQTLVEDIRYFELSADRKKLLVYKGKDLYVAEANGAKPDLAKTRLDLGNWSFQVDPIEEWRQMVVDAWRLERDYFYDTHLHGVNWKAILDRHLPLADRVTDRDELDDLLASMVSELSALHTFVRGGDKRRSPDQVATSSLGARLVKNTAQGGYTIAHIYRSDPDYPEELGPLDQPHLRVQEGDVITAINGVPVLETPDPNSLLPNAQGQQVRLALKKPSTGEVYEEVVEPISPAAAFNLRYNEWEYTRRQEVETRSGGRIGYVHLRAMSGQNYIEWIKNFYPVFNREGLIIDVRHNSGGNIDSWILEKLLRKAWFYWQPRVGDPSWNMQYAFRGHLVVLCNERTASDGEAFAEGFRRLGLGKVIGTRTWGGEIWLSGANFLVDRGVATASETGVYGPEGKWLIEGHGVDPDEVVDNLPHATFGGQDAQLQAGIEYLLKRIESDPRPVPPPPPYPDKSFRYRPDRQ